MRVELILEAVDRATRTINNVRAAVQGAATREERTANRAARFERRNQIAMEQAIERTNAARATSVEVTKQATAGAVAQAAAQVTAAQAIERSTTATTAQAEATRRAVSAQSAALAASARARVANRAALAAPPPPPVAAPAASPAAPRPPPSRRGMLGLPAPSIPPAAATVPHQAPRTTQAPAQPSMARRIVQRGQQVAGNYSSAGVQERIAAGRAAAAQSQGEATGNLVGAMATAASVAAPIAAAVHQWNTYEDVLTDIGLKANLTGVQLQQLGSRVRTQARALNTGAVEMLSAMDQMAAGGIDLRIAEQSFPAIIRAARATKAEVADLARSVVTLVNNVKVPASEIQRALDVMAQAGKEGQFELNDMARFFPQLGSQYASMGQTGVKAVADIAAALQVMRGQTGTAGEAVTNLNDLLSKMESGPAVKKLEEAGIDVAARMAEARRTGRVFETIHDILQQFTSGDVNKLHQLFQERNSRRGAQALLQDWEKFLRIREIALAANGTVVQDFLTRMGLGVEQARALSVAMQELGTSIGQILAPLSAEKAKQLTDIIWKIKAWAEANPELVRTIASVATAVAGLLVVLAALALVGAVVRSGLWTLLALFRPLGWAIGMVLAPLRFLVGFLPAFASGLGGAIAAGGGWLALLAAFGGRLLRLGGILLRVAGWLTGITPLFRILGTVGAWLVGPLAMAARGILMLGAALLALPFGWIIGIAAAVAGAAYWIYSNWAQIGPMLASAWAYIVSAMQSGWSALSSWVSSLASQLGAVIKAGLTDIFITIPTAIARAGMAALEAAWAALTGIISSAIEAAKSSAFTAWGGFTGAFAQSLATIWAALPPLNWDTVLTVLNWASWIIPIRWIELIPGFPGWSALIPDINWRSWFNFSWRDVLPKWEWSDIVPKMPNWRSWFSGSGEAANAANRIQAAARGPVTPAGVGGVASAAATLEASAATIASIGAKATEVQSMIQAIPAAATAAVSAAGAVLSAANFHSHGVSMMETLAAGIRAGAASAVAAARQTVQQIRDHLPHSPAKVGPLSDLDRVQFGQTLAGAITAGSPRAIMAARSLAAGLAATVPTGLPAPSMAAPTFAQAPAEAGRGAQGGGAAASGPISVSVSLSPSFSGSSSADFVQQLRQALPSIGYELAEAIQRELAKRQRTEH